MKRVKNIEKIYILLKHTVMNVGTYRHGHSICSMFPSLWHLIQFGVGVLRSEIEMLSQIIKVVKRLHTVHRIKVLCPHLKSVFSFDGTECCRQCLTFL